MSEAEHLASALTGLFTREDNGWFTPFSAAINGLTEEQAAKQPTEGFNSIWQITNHLIYWHEIILRRLQGDLSDITGWSDHHGWPSIPTRSFPFVTCKAYGWKRFNSL